MHITKLMKNQLVLPAMLFGAILLFGGCDKIKEVEMDKTVNMEFTVDIGPDDPLTLDLSAAFEFATGDLEEYKDQIKSYKVKEIRYKIWEFYTDEPGEDAILNGQLGIGKKTAAAPGVTYTMTDLSLLTNNDNPAHTPMNFSSANVQKIEQYLLDSNGLKLFLTGDVSSAPVHFKLQVVADVTAVVEK